MRFPFVSVIIPNYCHSKYLDERIESVLNQTYRNFELIILDDCSPDGGESKAVIEKYRNNPYVSHIIYNERNSGSTFKQWNKGFNLAKGELIWIAESDDYCDSNLLELCVDKFCRYDNLAIVHVTSIMVDKDGEIIDSKDTAEKIPDGYCDGVNFIINYMIVENVIWNASAVVFRKDYALNSDKSYMNYIAAGDHLFWILLAEQGAYYHISAPINYFRHHAIKVTPGKYRQGITHMEEFRTIQYILSKMNNAKDMIQRSYDSYIPQILYYNYDSASIRLSLMKLWYNANKMAFLKSTLNYYITRLINGGKKTLSKWFS